MEKCNCPACDELNVKNPKEVIDEFFKQVILVLAYGDQVELLDTLSALFNEGYRQGYTASTMLRIEEDAETLKYISNNWNV